MLAGPLAEALHQPSETWSAGPSHAPRPTPYRIRFSKTAEAPIPPPMHIVTMP